MSTLIGILILISQVAGIIMLIGNYGNRKWRTIVGIGMALFLVSFIGLTL